MTVSSLKTRIVQQPAKLNGLSVLRRIRSEPITKQLPVVMLTSSDEERDKIQCYAEGATKYLSKGSNMEAFAEAMKEAISLLE